MYIAFVTFCYLIRIFRAQKKLTRLVEAALYMAAKTMRNTYYQATGQKKGGSEKRK
jgi:hypothetical protein